MSLAYSKFYCAKRYKTECAIDVVRDKTECSIDALLAVVVLREHAEPVGAVIREIAAVLEGIFEAALAVAVLW